MDQLAQQKLQEEIKSLNKKILSPKELFGVVEEVQEEIIEEVEEEIVIDPYVGEIELLKNNLERVSLSIPEETDLTKVFQDIQILRNRIDNIPNQKEYSGDIESIREELVRIESSIPVPEVFDPSDLYENISALKNKIEEVRSEIPTIPEPILYDYQLDQLKEMVVDVRNSIPVVPEIRYYENELNEIIDAIEGVRSEIPELPEIKYYDDEISVIENRLIEIQNSIPVVPEIKYYDEDVKTLRDEIISVKNSIPEVKYYDKDVKQLKEQIKSIKNSIPVVPEIKYYDEDVKELKEEIASVKGSIPEVKYYDEEVKDLYRKVSAIKIPDQGKYLKQVKEIYSTFEEKNHKLLEKVKYLEEVFEKFNEETLTEGLLNEPPDVKNSDPLTPLDQNFVTLDQLKEHYRLFISRIQQQLSTIGGGGETRLEFLDDVDRTSAKINGRFLKYDAASGKWIGALGGGGGSQTLDDTLQLGNSSMLGMNVGVVTATYFVGDGSLLTNLPGGSSNSGYANTAGIATYSTSSGIATYASSAGIASYATNAGIATYSNTSGVSTFSGYSNTSGVSTISDYASTAGIATVAQNLTNSPNIIVSSVNSSGVVTALSFSGSGASLTALNATQLTTGTVPSTRITASSGDFTVGQNLYVNGILSVGGTSVILNAAQLQVKDKDIVVGYTTDANNNDVSNDTTANHGGISVASTVGSPIINIPLQIGINSNPSTYKQLMWVKAGNYSGLGTDVWLSNYAVSIGNTSSVQNGSRLTVGVGLTVYDTYLDAQDIRARNINATGIITATKLVTTYDDIYARGIIRIGQGDAGDAENHLVFGYEALFNYTPGGSSPQNNIAIGKKSLYSHTYGVENIAIGNAALYTNNGGEYNLSIGNDALRSNVYGTDNLALGNNALYSNTGSSNLAIGRGALFNGANISNNIAIGAYAGNGITGTSNNNIIIGSAIAFDSASGSNNVAIGYDVPNLTGSNQLAIGNYSGAWITGNSSYNIGIGTTNPTSKLHVVGDVRFTGIVTATYFVGDGSLLTNIPGSGGNSGYANTAGIATYASSAASIVDNTSSNQTFYVGISSVTTGNISVLNVSSTKLIFNPSTGNMIVGGTVTANSDERLKTNVTTIPNALDKVLSLRGVEYDRIDSGEHQIGVIAQEVEKVIPEVVYGSETKSVAYGNLIGLLIEAIKEQNIEIQKLKDELHQRNS